LRAGTGGCRTTFERLFLTADDANNTDWETGAWASPHSSSVASPKVFGVENLSLQAMPIKALLVALKAFFAGEIFAIAQSHHTISALNIRITSTALLIGTFLAAPVLAGDNLLPDPMLTPGRVARNCQDRNGVTEEMERHVFSLYCIPWRRRPEFKVDHLIPPELGGADSIDNLWPQSLYTRPYNPERKELLTRRLLALIASGEMTLTQAQREIREDWISCFVEHLGMVYLR
jgi:hypothetical protein